MTMQIHTIVIYHRDGRTREVNFNLNAVNIITGENNTGKSTLIDIIEFCLGRSEYGVTFVKEVGENIVAFGILYQLVDRQFFVAKHVPRGKSRRTLFFTEQEEISIPALDDINDNSDDEELKEYLSKLIDIPENEIEPTSNLPKYSANIRHTIHYIFMKKPNDDEYLFYNQEGTMRATTIRQTLPVLFRAVKPNYVELKRLFSQKTRIRRELRQEIEDAQSTQARGVSLIPGLILEAQQLGLMSGDIEQSDDLELRRILDNLVKQGMPSTVIETDTSALTLLQEQMQQLRQQEAITQTKLSQYVEYQREATQYERAASEHDHRLSMVELFDNGESHANTCPICGSTLADTNQDVEDLQRAHRHIQQQVQIVQMKRPVLTEAIDNVRTQLRDIKQQIRQVGTDIQTILEAQDQARRIQTPRQRIANFLGQAEMFLRLAPIQEDEIEDLSQRLRRLDSEIEDIESEIEEAEGAGLLESAIFEISRYMTEYGGQIGDEYRGASFQFNLSRLTVIANRHGDAREYSRIGSDKNYLQIHIALYLAFHRYFVTYNCPVPRFILIDQVDRPFYPDDANYNSLHNPEELMSDPDREAVLEIFDLFTKFCNEFNIQIIVLQHANFPTADYQNLVIENWRDGNALIPSDWID